MQAKGVNPGTPANAASVNLTGVTESLYRAWNRLNEENNEYKQHDATQLLGDSTHIIRADQGSVRQPEA